MDNENGREKANEENEERVFGRRSALHNNRGTGANISVSFNDGRSETLRTITTEEKSKRINEIAKMRAKRSDIKTGWQKLISYNDKGYVVEKFDDFDSGYLIVESINKKDYDKVDPSLKFVYFLQISVDFFIHIT